MGCFDFTYADTGRNIRGGYGYIYLTDKFAEEMDWKNKEPIQFVATDDYGTFYIVRPTDRKEFSIDIHVLYTAMLYIEEAISVEEEVKKDLVRFINLFRKFLCGLEMNGEDFTEFDGYLELRGPSIDYFFRQRVKIVPTKFLITPPGRKKEHICMIREIFIGKFPLLITKKKMEWNSYSDIIHNWGFVSDSDPNQGFSQTKDHFLLWGKGK